MKNYKTIERTDYGQMLKKINISDEIDLNSFG